MAKELGSTWTTTLKETQTSKIWSKMN